MFINFSFNSTDLLSTKNKLDCYRGKDCMEKFCKDLREHPARIISYEKKEISFIKSKKSVTYATKNLVVMIMIKKYQKVKDHCHYTRKLKGAAHSSCNLGYKTQKKFL